MLHVAINLAEILFVNKIIFQHHIS